MSISKEKFRKKENLNIKRNFIKNFDSVAKLSPYRANSGIYN